MQIDAAIANIAAIAAIFGFLLLERTSGVSLVIFGPEIGFGGYPRARRATLITCLIGVHSQS